MPGCITVHCGIDSLGEALRSTLEVADVSPRELNELHLIVDGPWSWALAACEHVPLERAAIITDNPCPEYQLDLMDLGPLALLHDVQTSDIVKIIRTLNPEKPLYPHVTTPLTHVERDTLHLAALGYHPGDIALLRDRGVQTVKNHLHTMHQKLNLHNHLQLSRYYHGNWHLLPARWLPPAHVTVPKALRQYVRTGTT